MVTHGSTQPLALSRRGVGGAVDMGQATLGKLAMLQRELTTGPAAAAVTAATAPGSDGEQEDADDSELSLSWHYLQAQAAHVEKVRIPLDDVR